jgi:hypothetical protein
VWKPVAKCHQPVDTLSRTPAPHKATPAGKRVQHIAKRVSTPGQPFPVTTHHAHNRLAISKRCGAQTERFMQRAALSHTGRHLCFMGFYARAPIIRLPDSPTPVPQAPPLFTSSATPMPTSLKHTGQQRQRQCHGQQPRPCGQQLQQWRLRTSVKTPKRAARAPAPGPCRVAGHSRCEQGNARRPGSLILGSWPPQNTLATQSPVTDSSASYFNTSMALLANPPPVCCPTPARNVHARLSPRFARRPRAARCPPCPWMAPSLELR